MSTAASALSTVESVTAYAARSISWDTTTLASGTTYPAGVLIPDVVLEERHDDQSVITENPVEHGSMTSDHAYEQPPECEVSWVWSPSGGSLFSLRASTFIQQQYDKLLDLKKNFILLNVVTGKRTYSNMLIQGISEVTEEKTENVLSVRLFLKWINFTLTETVTIASADNQSMPEKTAPIVNSGTLSLQPASNFNTGGVDGADRIRYPATGD